MTIKSKKPSVELINAVKTYLLAKSHEQVIRDIVLPYQIEILADHKWSIDPRWAERDLPYEIILDPNLTYLMTNTDSLIYHTLLHEQDRLHFPAFKAEKPDSCPLLVAENDRITAEREVIKATVCLTGQVIDPATLSMDNWRKFVDLTVGYVVSIEPTITKESVLQMLA